MKQKVLLHVCCGPCSTHSVKELLKEYDVVMFFSDSNIWPESEYEKRLLNAKKVAEKLNVEFIVDSYEHSKWLEFIKGLEKEPEAGKRCLKCFEFNLKGAFDYAKKNNLDLFTTSLTISPYKDSKSIFKIGKNISETFLDKDFKKDNGYQKSIELSKEFKLYRQKYCGCEFSLSNRDLRSHRNPKI